MTISSFDDLLRTAAAQAEPQRLLFLFAQKGEIEKRSGAAIDRSATISGGTLTPIMCVDKGLDELTSFDGLSQESEALGKSWDIVLVACMAGNTQLVCHALAYENTLFVEALWPLPRAN